MSAPASYFSGVSTARRAVDLAVLGALFVLALLGFHPVYGGIQYVLAGVMALVLATLIALIGARWRWGPLRMTPLLLAVYFLFGTVFAAPTHALWGLLPTPGSLKELLFAPVTSWKATLTVAPPVGTSQGVLAVVWISVLILSLLAMTIVMRTRHYVIAWLFPLALVVVAFAFGTTEAFWPVIRGTLFAVISVAWLTWRFEGARLAGARSTIIADTVRPGSWKNPVLRRRVVGGALIMALAGGASFAAQSLLEPPPGQARYAVRDNITPPFDPREYVSPLADFRGYIKNQRDTELFTVSGVSGGQYIRLATLDDYDLHVYNVADSREKNGPSGSFLRTADGVDLEDATEEQRTSTITIGGYTGVWMPTLGTRVDRIDLDLPSDRAGGMAESLFLNSMSQTAVTTQGLREGDVYELSYEPYTEPTTEQQRSATFADVELPTGGELDDVAQLAEEWAGSSESDYERFQNLTRSIKTDAYFSHGLDGDTVSLSGHGASRLQAMLEEFGFDEEKSDAAPTGRIGDQEQYAALTAVMARSIDIPARVGMGFEVPEGQDGNASITGKDVTAWVEVAFDGLGWVRFYPAPEEDEEPTQPEPKEVDKPLPQVAQPPPPPAEPPTPPPGAMSDDTDDDDEDTEEGRSWIVYTLVGTTPVLLVALVLGAVVLAKVVRRNRRSSRGGLVDRVDGGWQEILDLMTDLGLRPDPVLTRQETAAQLQADIPAMGALTLAARADRAVFGPDDIPLQASEEYWQQVRAARRSMTTAMPWHRRLLAVFSLRSFRRPAADRRREKRRVRANRRARSRAEKQAASMRRRRSSMHSTATTSSRKGLFR